MLNDSYLQDRTLVRAVKLESSVGYPAVTFSPEVDLTLAAWVPRYEHGLLPAPVLHFSGLSFVNPFNPYWFQSARMRVSQMLDTYPEHAKKYRWFLDLTKAVDDDESLIPEAVLNELLQKGVLVPKTSAFSSAEGQNVV